MVEVQFCSVAAMAQWCASADLYYEQCNPLAVEGVALYSRYRIMKKGMIIGHALITPHGSMCW